MNSRFTFLFFRCTDVKAFYVTEYISYIPPKIYRRPWTSSIDWHLYDFHQQNFQQNFINMNLINRLTFSQLFTQLCSKTVIYTIWLLFFIYKIWSPNLDWVSPTNLKSLRILLFISLLVCVYIIDLHDQISTICIILVRLLFMPCHIYNSAIYSVYLGHNGVFFC